MVIHMTDDQNNRISGELNSAALPLSMHVFETSRFNGFNFSSVDENHALIANPDQNSPIKALLVSLHGKTTEGNNRAFSVYALGHTTNLQDYLDETGILIESDLIRNGKPQIGALIGAPYNTPESLSLEAKHRPEIQDGIKKGLQTLNINIDSKTVDLVCLLDLSNVATEIVYARSYPDDLPEGNKRFINTTVAEVLNRETQDLFQDLYDTQTLSEDKKANVLPIIQMWKFIEDNYTESKLNIAIRSNRQDSEQTITLDENPSLK